jgi:hypothetical protein
MSDIVFRLRRWLGLLPDDYDCFGCIECVYPDGLGNAYKQGEFIDYAKMFGLVDEKPKYVMYGKTHTEQVWF